MPNEIKDKIRLISKLFISATYIEQSDPPLLVSPHFIDLIMNEAQKTPRQYQLQIINQILDIFVARDTSSLILYGSDDSVSDSQQNILDSLVMWMLKTIQNKQQAQQYLKKIPALLSYYATSLKNIAKLTQYLSIAFYQQNFNCPKMFFIASLLKLYVSPKRGLINSPRHFFYIYGGKNNCCIKTVPHNPDMPVKNSFFLSLVFKHMMQQAFGQSNFFLISTTKDQRIIANFDKNNLFLGIKFEHEKQYRLHRIQHQIRSNKWYRLTVQFTNHQTIVRINQSQYKIVALITKQKERFIKECVFGQNFHGMMTSMFMANKIPTREQFSFEQFPFGIQSWDSVSKFKKQSDFFNNILFSCLPFSVFEIRYQMHCFDLFKRMHSTIGQNIAIWKNYTVACNTQINGGIKVVLPLFYLARFFSIKEYPQLIEDLLTILIIMMKESPSEIVQQEFIQQNVLLILGQHLKVCQQFVTRKVLTQLWEIDSYFKLQQNQRDFLKYVLWGIGMNKNFEKQIIQQHYTYLIQKYLRSNKKHPSKNKIGWDVLSFVNAIYFMVKNLQDSTRSCCIQHYTNQCILGDQFDIAQAQILKAQNIQLHYSWIQTIGSTILQNQILQIYQLKTSNSSISHSQSLKKLGQSSYDYSKHDKANQLGQQKNINQNKIYDKVVFQFKSILRLLMHKYSTCLYTVVLRIVKKQVNLFSKNKKLLALLTSKVNILLFLSYLSQKTIDNIIIIDIVYILLIAYKGAEPNSKHRYDIVRFLKQLFCRIGDFPKSQANPALVAARKCRKNSFDFIRQPSKQTIQQRVTHNKLNKSQIRIKNQQKNENSFQQSNNRYFRSKSAFKVKQHNNSASFSATTFQQSPIYDLKSFWRQLKYASPQNIRSQQKLYIVLKNFMMGVISQETLKDGIKFGSKIQGQNSQSNFKILNNDSLQLLHQYFKVCDESIKQIILKDLLQCLMINSSNVVFFEDSSSLNLILIQAIGAKIQKTTVMGQMAIKIIGTVFQTKIRKNQNVGNYYVYLKALLGSRKQFFIDLLYIVFRDLLGRRVLNRQSLSTLLMIIEFETLQSKVSQANLSELTIIVLQQLIEDIQKHYYKYICEQFKQQNKVNKNQRDKKQLKGSYGQIQDRFSDKNNSERGSTRRLNIEDQQGVRIDSIEYLLLLMVNRHEIKVPFFQTFINTGIIEEEITFNFDNILSKLQIDSKTAMFDLTKMSKKYYLFEIFVEALSRVIWQIIDQNMLQYSQNRKQSVEVISVVDTEFDQQIKKRAYSVNQHEIDSLHKQIILDQNQNIKQQQKYKKQEQCIVQNFNKIIINSSKLIGQVNQSVSTTLKTRKSKRFSKKSNFSKAKTFQQKQVFDIKCALNLLDRLTQMLLFYVNMKMCSQNLAQNQSARLFVIMVSNLLLQLSQNQAGIFQYKQIGEKAQTHFVEIWSYILKILAHYAKDQSVQNMEMLFNRIVQFQLNPIFVQVFQYFVKFQSEQSTSEKVISKRKQEYQSNQQSNSQLEKKKQEQKQQQQQKHPIDNVKFEQKTQKQRKISSCSSIQAIRLVELITIKQLRQFSDNQKQLIRFIKDKKFHDALMMNGKVVQVLLQCFYKNTRYIKQAYFRQVSEAQSKIAEQVDKIQRTIQNRPQVSSINNDSHNSSNATIKNNKPSKDKKVNSQITSNNQQFFKTQHLFDSENTQQEDTRLRYLHEQDKQLRNFHSVWRKLWNNLRIYHQPYGFWMAQKDSKAKYTYENTEHKNFKFVVSKYTSSSGISPVLQAQIVEPWHILKVLWNQKHKYLASFTDMMRESLMAEQQRKENSIDIGAQMLKSMWKNIWKPGNIVKQLTGYKKMKEYEVKWIQGNLKARGKVVIRQEELIFYYDGVQQQDSHLSFEKFILPIHKPTFHIWRLATIVRVNERRYLLRYTAIQLQLNTTQRILLNFPKQDHEQFINDLDNVRSKVTFSSQNKIKNNKVSFYQSGWLRKVGIDQSITQDWVNRRISNLQYLIQINNAACRNINDLSQYLVVPWVVEMNNDKEPILRDLSKTLGSIGSEERKKIVIEKYKSKDPFNPVPPFYYGTHYSSPGVVFNFLIRLSPFTQHCKRLQGGKFDIADRLFSSFINSWKSATTQVSDVRELVPQFYYLPQCLINIQGHNLGQTQSGDKVNDIQMPPWSANNPYFFVIQMRQILQSPTVSNDINKWIDLIFGFKQRGKQAEQALNVYYYLTYEQHLKTIQLNQDDEIHRKSCEAQIVHFGQIPPQIFNKPHPQRNPAKNCVLQIDFSLRFKLMNHFKQKIVGLWLSSTNSEMKIVKRNTIQTLAVSRHPPTLQKQVKFNLEKSRDQTYYLIKKEKAQCVFFKHFFIIYGYMNNQFRIFNRSNGNLQDYDTLQSTVTFIHVNDDNDLILVGCHSGILHIYEIQYDGNGFYIKKKHTQNFPAKISHISEKDGFFAISFGNYVGIYKFSRSLDYMDHRQSKSGGQQAKIFVKFFRSFKCNLSVKSAFIITSPLYGVIICDNANIRAYSINGQFLKSITSNTRYLGMMQDSDLNDLIYYVQEQRVVLISTPDLRNLSEVEIKDYFQIYGHFVIFKDEVAIIGLQRKIQRA